MPGVWDQNALRGPHGVPSPRYFQGPRPLRFSELSGEFFFRLFRVFPVFVFSFFHFASHFCSFLFVLSVFFHVVFFRIFSVLLSFSVFSLTREGDCP